MGENAYYGYCYRVYDAVGLPIKFCTFQQLDYFACTMGIAVEDIPIVDDEYSAATAVADWSHAHSLSSQFFVDHFFQLMVHRKHTAKDT